MPEPPAGVGPLLLHVLLRMVHPPVAAMPSCPLERAVQLVMVLAASRLKPKVLLLKAVQPLNVLPMLPAKPP
jgi:hypothetical protein